MKNKLLLLLASLALVSCGQQNVAESSSSEEATTISSSNESSSSSYQTSKETSVNVTFTVSEAPAPVAGSYPSDLTQMEKGGLNVEMFGVMKGEKNKIPAIQMRNAQKGENRFYTEDLFTGMITVTYLINSAYYDGMEHDFTGCLTPRCGLDPRALHPASTSNIEDLDATHRQLSFSVENSYCGISNDSEYVVFITEISFVGTLSAD